MEDKELERLFGLSPDEIERRSAQYESGEWKDGTTVPMGRPSLYGARMKSITYRDTEQEAALMDKRAASLGMSRSDYLRHLVRQDLASA